MAGSGGNMGIDEDDGEPTFFTEAEIRRGGLLWGLGGRSLECLVVVLL